MAAETPVLERRPEEKQRANYYPAQSYANSYKDEVTHNARIRDNYARLINPESKIADIFSANLEKEVVEEKREEKVESTTSQRIYLVENARADSALFRADNPINMAHAAVESAEIVDELEDEEEDEDLRPTPTTIQYQTIGRASANIEFKSSTGKSNRALTKKEKIVIAVYVCVIVALLTLVIVNSFIISGLNESIATVQSEINTVRGALAGVNSSIAELVPETVLDMLIK